MQAFNVEIFERNFTLRSHTVVEDVQFSEDYLSPDDNELTLLTLEAQKGDYIRITNGSDEYFGIINTVSSKEEGLVEIGYKPFLSLFDTDCMFDTNWQGGTVSLEQTLANIITNMFISNSDSSMNVPGLSVSTISSTASWGFNLKSDTENMHHCIINLLDVLIIGAMELYSVCIQVVPDIQNRTIALRIGKNASAAVTVEADLPNVINKNVVIKETNNDVNKLVVYDTESYTTTRSYYLHPNGRYDMTNSNRIVPVVQEIRGTAPERNGETITKTFAQMADSEAADVFGSIEYNNLIELEMQNDDSLVKPYQMEVGQVVNVISDGVSYSSILTGRKVEQTTTLTFGTVRLDLTKILRRNK